MSQCPAWAAIPWPKRIGSESRFFLTTKGLIIRWRTRMYPSWVSTLWDSALKPRDSIISGTVRCASASHESLWMNLSTGLAKSDTVSVRDSGIREGITSVARVRIRFMMSFTFERIEKVKLMKRSLIRLWEKEEGKLWVKLTGKYQVCFFLPRDFSSPSSLLHTHMLFHLRYFHFMGREMTVRRNSAVREWERRRKRERERMIWNNSTSLVRQWNPRGESNLRTHKPVVVHQFLNYKFNDQIIFLILFPTSWFFNSIVTHSIWKRLHVLHSDVIFLVSLPWLYFFHHSNDMKYYLKETNHSMHC